MNFSFFCSCFGSMRKHKLASNSKLYKKLHENCKCTTILESPWKGCRGEREMYVLPPLPFLSQSFLFPWRRQSRLSSGRKIDDNRRPLQEGRRRGMMGYPSLTDPVRAGRPSSAHSACPIQTLPSPAEKRKSLGASNTRTMVDPKEKWPKSCPLRISTSPSAKSLWLK